jgi:hypothetical protein
MNRAAAAAANDPRSARRLGLWLALGFLGAAAVTALRALAAGTIRVDQAPLPLWLRLVLGLLFGACVFAAGHRWMQTLASPPPARTTLKLALALHLCAALALPYTSNDLFSNLAYGRLARLGLDPYVSAPSALPEGDPFKELVGERWRETRSVYGPGVVLLDAAAITDSVAGSMVLLKLFTLLLTLGAVLLAHGLCARLGPLRDRAFLFFACNPLLAWELSAQAHNDALVVLSLLGFAWAALEEREAVAVAALALGLSCKVSVAPVLGLYLVQLLRRAPLKAVLLGLLALCIAAAFLWPFWHGPQTLAAPLEATVGTATRHTRSFIDLALLLVEPFGQRPMDLAGVVLRRLGGALLFAYSARAAWKTRSLEDVFSFSLGFFLIYDLALSPWFQPWYATWLLPLLLPLSEGARALAAPYSFWTCVQYCLPIDPVNNVLIDLVTLRRIGLRRLVEGVR